MGIKAEGERMKVQCEECGQWVEVSEDLYEEGDDYVCRRCEIDLKNESMGADLDHDLAYGSD